MEKYSESSEFLKNAHSSVSDMSEETQELPTDVGIPHRLAAEPEKSYQRKTKKL